MSIPSVSVIIPVYNAALTIGRCLDSLLGQTVDDIEIIAVDDGSTDNTPELLEDYASRDPRLKILLPGHGGVSMARNRGIEAATGRWLTFVDADDYVAPDFIGTLLPSVGEVELCVAGYSVVDPGKEPYAVGTCNDKLVVDIDGGCSCRELLDGLEIYHLGFIWSKLFRRDIVMERSLRFDCGISFGEDGIFCFSYFRYVSNCHVSAAAAYFYVRPEGATTLSTSARADTRLAGINSFWATVDSLKLKSSRLRRKLEFHYLDGILNTIVKDSRGGPRYLSPADRYECYENIRRRVSSEVYRPYLPVFFDLCGRFHCWRLYERLYKIIYRQ